jgi:Na+(H+)/acetate symporter ActP
VFELNNWIPALFNLGRRQNILNMFGRRRNNRGMMWASLLGLGVSAAAYGLGRNQNRNMMAPFQNLISNFRTRNSGQMPNMAALTEFSKELAPNRESSKK